MVFDSLFIIINKMEWELLLICNCLGLIALALIFFYHFADVDGEEERIYQKELKSRELLL